MIPPLFLVLSSCATAREQPMHEVPPGPFEDNTYLKCTRRYDYYRCCYRDLDTDRIVGKCFNTEEV